MTRVRRRTAKPARASATTSHYRRAAIAGGLIAALLVILTAVDEPVPAESARAEVSETLPPSGADPASPMAPAPLITAISIPPRPDVQPVSHPPSEPVAQASVAVAAEGAEAAPAVPQASEAPDRDPPAAAGVSAPAAVPALPPPGDGYFIQLGVFGAQANAEALRQELAATGAPAYLESRVVVGPYPTRKAAESARARLRAHGHPEGLLVPPRKP